MRRGVEGAKLKSDSKWGEKKKTGGTQLNLSGGFVRASEGSLSALFIARASREK